MKMRKTIYVFLAALLTTSFGFSQRPSSIAVGTGSSDFGRTVGATNRPGNILIPVTHLRLVDVDKSALKENAELEKKKYLNYTYDLASVDNYDTKAYVRYNIFNDEMEFVKDESIYYLAKEVGRQVTFINTKDVYRIYDLNGDLHFFKIYVSGKNSLIAKHNIRYVDAKVAVTGYDRDKPANYKRLKDDIYLALGDKKLVDLSSMKKKDFFKVFGDKEAQMKKYAKENKLGSKDIDDLEKLVAYFNTL